MLHDNYNNNNDNNNNNNNTLSGSLGKLVDAYDEGCKVDSRQRHHRLILCTIHSGGTAHEGGGNGQSIVSTLSDVIVLRLLRRSQLAVAHWAT